MTMAPEAPPGSQAAPDSVPAVVRRRLAPLDRHVDAHAWLAIGVVTVVAGLLRFVGLSKPPGMLFDEAYYATDAHNLLRLGYEWDEKANTARWAVHPPLGSWIIALGEWRFGYHEFGWRFMAAVFGTASVLMFVLLAKRLFGSTVLACAAGLLMAFDGAHFVLSRSAMLDLFLMFFVLAAFFCLVLDRDQRRRRWLRFIESGGDPSGRGRASRPPFAVPWWRLATAVMMACALSVKWSALAFLPVIFALILWWEIGARRSAGARHPVVDALLDETGWFLAFLGIVFVLYLASWSGWLLTDGGYNRHYLRDTGQIELPVIGALQNLWHHHAASYDFHTHLTTKHPYQSRPWQWLLLARPLVFYWSNTGPCPSANCAAEVLLNGTPLLWWSFLPALAGLIWVGLSRRDWRAGAILAFVAAGWLPWFVYELDHRTMFFSYALPIEPFLILAVVYMLGYFMTPDPARPFDEQRRTYGAVIAGTYVMLVALNFAYFYPIFTGQSIPYDAWLQRMWLGNRWF